MLARRTQDSREPDLHLEAIYLLVKIFEFIAHHILDT
jgi:hypothetical protein